MYLDIPFSLYASCPWCKRELRKGFYNVWISFFFSSPSRSLQALKHQSDIRVYSGFSSGIPASFCIDGVGICRSADPRRIFNHSWWSSTPRCSRNIIESAIPKLLLHGILGLSADTVSSISSARCPSIQTVLLNIMTSCLFKLRRAQWASGIMVAFMMWKNVSSFSNTPVGNANESFQPLASQTFPTQPTMNRIVSYPSGIFHFHSLTKWQSGPLEKRGSSARLIQNCYEPICTLSNPISERHSVSSNR